MTWSAQKHFTGMIWLCLLRPFLTPAHNYFLHARPLMRPFLSMCLVSMDVDMQLRLRPMPGDAFVGSLKRCMRPTSSPHAPTTPLGLQCGDDIGKAAQAPGGASLIAGDVSTRKLPEAQLLQSRINWPAVSIATLP